jgi:hypothetical protein
MLPMITFVRINVSVVYISGSAHLPSWLKRLRFSLLLDNRGILGDRQDLRLMNLLARRANVIFSSRSETTLEETGHDIQRRFGVKAEVIPSDLVP